MNVVIQISYIKKIVAVGSWLTSLFSYLGKQINTLWYEDFWQKDMIHTIQGFSKKFLVFKFRIGNAIYKSIKNLV